jgi:membrane protease subunit (stomatin/prohibitin family)
MGIFDFVKGGVRELMVARPDQAKHLIVYKHPDQTIPFYSQLTVDSDECAVFFKDGKVVGVLPTGRHTLQTQNIPFLSNIVDKFTGGNVFISEIFFVRTQPVRGIPFGGPLESMEDPILYEFVTPRIFGEFSLIVTDPIRFIVGYHGQAAGPGDNDAVLGWVKGLFFMSVKTTIGQTCAQQGKSLLNLGGMTMEIANRIQQSAPNLDDIGVKIQQIGNFNINFSAEDQTLLREANKVRGEARRGVAIAGDKAAAKQVELDQRFQQDARYVQQLAGNWGNYAAGSAMMGAGEGMAKGGANVGVAAVGAQMAAGMGMANMMQPQFGQPHMQQPGMAHGAPGMAPGMAPVAPPTVPKVACPKCSAQVPPGKFCAECGGVLAAPKRFCTGCATELAPAGKFCANCGTPAPAG